MTLQTRSNLHTFSISGLFGTRDVSLRFDKPINILMGENGLGKTTVLNALYYTLTCNFSKLNSIAFSKITLSFWECESIEFSKSDIYLEDPSADSTYHRERSIWVAVRKYLTTNDRRVIRDIQQSSDSDEEKNMRYLRIASRISNHTPYSMPALHRALVTMFSEAGGRVESIIEKIKANIPEEIIYLPTYRRIEEELHNLGSSKVEFEKGNKLLIQFGMNDVEAIFDKLLLSIKNSAISGFSKITGDTLKQYIDGVNSPDYETIQKIQSGNLRIILARVGENISELYKDEIISLVSTGQIFEDDNRYKYLINFLANLIDVYEQQSATDTLIKNFATVCNKYLYGKQFVYNESNVSLGVFQKKNNVPIELKNLSSGEKQIISLFTRIYLESGPRLIVLFDEPELSLSIEWQKIILPDVVNSNKCNLLLAVTHSPFVFDNEFDEIAEDMTKYVVEQ